MRRARRLLLPCLLFCGVSRILIAQGCPPPNQANVFIFYTGALSGCSPINGTLCQPGETIAFQAATFGFNFTCAVYMFQWNFGDGGTGNGINATHTYTAPGVYNVTLTVTPAGGTPIVYTALVQVGQPVPAFTAYAYVALALALAALGAFRTAT